MRKQLECIYWECWELVLTIFDSILSKDICFWSFISKKYVKTVSMAKFKNYRCFEWVNSSTKLG